MDKNPLGPSVLGLRLEGPYISKAKAGAQDKRYIRRPNVKELSKIIERSSPVFRMMTIAPEKKGALSLVRALVKNGIIASIGHSYATYDEAKQGISAGIRHATHVFNAMRGTDGCKPGVVGAALSDNRVFAEIILDLIHVRETFFGLLVRAKGLDKVVLVTDSVKALHQKGVKKALGAYRFAGGRLAGSALTMMGAVKNAVTACGLSLPDAVRLATLNPARLLSAQVRKGAIEAGKDADIVIFDKDFNVKMTIVRGKIMYRKRGF
jgi:N-acetylglucosamine-6-phosphate deacetylase